MKIGKNWEIKADDNNVTLLRRHRVKATDKKPAHDTWAVKGFYSSISNALKALVDFKLAESELKDLKSIIQKQEEIYTMIEALTNLP